MRQFACSLAILMLFSWAISAAQSKGAFITTLGNDTLAVEQYSMSGNELTGVSIVRAPQMIVRTFRISFGPEGRLERFHVEFQPYGKPVAAERDYQYFADSVQVTMKQGGTERQFGVPTSERPVPFFADIFAGWSIAIQQAVNQNKPQFGILTGRSLRHYDVKVDGQKVDLLNSDSDFGPMHVVMGPHGEFAQFDMRATTDKYIINRVPSLDMKAVEMRFEQMEQMGKGLGSLSPRDTVRATINGGHIMMDYGRPSMRGRVVFGNMVPWGQVWRTGANAATQLISDKTIMIGGTMIEPGTYSVFTLPSEQGWMLIINGQHGQWGTVYDQTRDIVRVPLQLKQLTDPVEQFVFEIIPRGSHGTLVYRWEQTEASVDFMVH